MTWRACLTLVTCGCLWAVAGCTAPVLPVGPSETNRPGPWRTLADQASTLDVDASASPSAPKDTKITLKKGDALSINAKGEWQIGKEAKWKSDANGGTVFPSQNGMNYGALIGRIGEKGKWFLIGKEYNGPASADGNLFLACNDREGLYGDNSGKLSVTIEVNP